MFMTNTIKKDVCEVAKEFVVMCMQKGVSENKTFELMNELIDLVETKSPEECQKIWYKSVNEAMKEVEYDFSKDYGTIS